MNKDLLKLQTYPFERLRELKANLTPPDNLHHIALSMGEPKHPAPDFVYDALLTHKQGLSSYPLTKGLSSLRSAIQNWLVSRFKLDTDSLDPDQHILPVNGTREALFAFAQTVVDRQADKNGTPLVLMPNPFYQIYEGAALLAGAEPWFMNTTSETGYKPDFSAVPESVWQRCQLLYICTPGNPSGAVLSIDELKQVIMLADKYDFVIASDECYSELYFDEDKPPPSLLSAAKSMGRDDYSRCIAFHSLSKRSNLPGLRSGFVAGDANILSDFLRYRTYHGCAMPEHHQKLSEAVWSDESHVQENRELYRKKFTQALKILQPVIDIRMPDASFYFWLKTPIDDTEFAQRLFAQQNLTALPGQYLSRHAHGINPGQNHIRLALVANEQECLEAIHRIKTTLQSI